jgi:signal transduction histidine kinase
VAPALGLTIYRIVQEALTNIRKHAGDARATVRLSYAPGAITTEVSDTGAASGAIPVPRPDGTGHGLIGMRERVAMYGGTLQLDHPSGGGFVVRAQLPIEAES